MKVALVSAPYDTRLFRIGENLGIRYLAAILLQEGVSVDVIEPSLEGIDDNLLTTQLLQNSYSLIGFSVMFDIAFSNVIEIAKKLRSLGCQAHITLGGHFPTFNDREILEKVCEIDSVVRFEGEITLLELINKLDASSQWDSVRGLTFRRDGYIISNPIRSLMPDLDALPFPYRNTTSQHLRDPHFFMITTRGCPFICTYCSIPTFYKTPNGSPWRARSVKNVMDEIKYLEEEWNATAISFLDDEFLVGKQGKKRAIVLATEIAESDLSIAWAAECRSDDVEKSLFTVLKDGGLRHVFLGIESGTQQVLDRFKKMTTVQQNRQAIEVVRELGISLAIGFIMFDPYTSMDELKSNVNFLNEMGLATYRAVANKITIYKGTELEVTLSRDGRLIRDGFRCDFAFSDPNVAYVHHVIKSFLWPAGILNTLQNRIEFKIDNRSYKATQIPAKRHFEAVREQINFEFVRLLNTIIIFAENYLNADHKTISRFENEIQDFVEEHTNKNKKILEELYSQL